jgi:hypothetical protein
MDKDKIQELRLMQSKEVRFYPHTDSTAYYTVNCTLVKPFYIKNLYSTDGCKVVFETDRYQEIILKDDYLDIKECFSMNDLSGVGMIGNSFTKYGTAALSAGLLGNSIQLASGSANYLRFANPVSAPLGFGLHTWVNIPYDTDTGYFFTLSSDGLANQSVALWKRGGWTAAGGLVEVFIGGVSKGDITLIAGQWHLLSVLQSGIDLTLCLDGVLKFVQAKGTTSTEYIYLGAGTGDRPFIIKFDQTAVINNKYYTAAGIANYVYNSGKGRLIDMPKFYLS